MAVRQSLLDGMPVVSTSMRVPGGDVVQHVYGGTPNAAVVEIINESPAPFVVALVVRGASHVDTDGVILFVDRRPAILCIRPPAMWAMTDDATTAQIVTGGDARDDAFAPRSDRAARLEAAFLFPVAHQTAPAIRRAAPAKRRGRQLTTLPGAEAVARGWRAQLDRGMRVELPDTQLQAAVDSARAQLLLVGQAWMAIPEVVVALEDWGFDDEARAAWVRLGMFARRKAARRPSDRSSWDDVRRHSAASAAQFLNSLRSALVDARGTDIALVGSLAAGVAWAAVRRAGRADEAGTGFLLAALAWQPGRAALGRAPGRDRAHPRARCRVVERRAARRDASRNRRVTRYGRRAMEPYRRAAHAYDLFYQDKDYRGEVEEIAGLVEAHRPGARSVLDVGCGTGAHLEWFAQRYERAEGIEPSARMIEEATIARPGLLIYPGDMRTFRHGDRFDVVTSLFSAIGYMTTIDDLHRAVRNMAAHLTEGGVLVVEGWVEPDTWKGSRASSQAVVGDEVVAARVVVSGREGEVSTHRDALPARHRRWGRAHRRGAPDGPVHRRSVPRRGRGGRSSLRARRRPHWPGHPHGHQLTLREPFAPDDSSLTASRDSRLAAVRS